jgi:flagellum-specific ATP synthase
MRALDTERFRRWLERTELLRFEGRVAKIAGLFVEATGLPLGVGELCEIVSPRGEVTAEVIGFRDGRTLLMPHREIPGLAPGSAVLPRAGAALAPAGPAVLGRVLDGFGGPIDGRGPIAGAVFVPVARQAPPPLSRRPISGPFGTGIRAIDGLITLARGQRVGIFAGSGVGKSTLLGEIVKSSQAEVSVIALIGERGREVGEFLERSLGEAGRQRSVVVAATSDTPAIERLRGAFVAAAIAEWFRDEGADVLFVMDSVTRFASAVREIGLAAGEPLAARGFPPSLYSTLPKLIERLGTAERGSITGLLTVLVEGDDLQEPVADALRSLLDGHIVLSRRLAERGHYPAIDVLASVSRTFPRIASDLHQRAAGRFRELLAVYESSRDLVEVGAYRSGANPRLDQALKLLEPMRRFLQQDCGRASPFAETVAELIKLVGMGGP